MLFLLLNTQPINNVLAALENRQWRESPEYSLHVQGVLYKRDILETLCYYTGK